MSKITQEIAQRIIDEYCGGLSTFALADKYDLWQTSICNLISGRSWGKCQRPDNIKNLIKQRHEKGLYEKGRKCHIDAPPLTDLQHDVMIGSLLGDGSIDRRSVNPDFRKKQVKTNLKYLQWHRSILQPYSSTIDPIYSKEKLIGGKGGIILERQKVEKYLSGYNFRTHQHPVFRELRNKWYDDKTKIVPNDLVLNPQRIAIWFFDDGSNQLSHRTAILCTQSFTLEEADFLCQKLNDFDMKPKVTKVLSQYTGRQMPILKFTKSSYDNLINLVKPFCLWDCFKYKVEWRPAKKQWEYSGKFTLEQIEQIKELRKTKTARQLADQFNVHVNTIYAIVSGRSWK